jgi:apolipoprotein N-acyltransferase
MDKQKFITKENFSYRLQQLAIFIIHLILLKWMYYTLAEGGTMDVTEVLIHFTGMGIYGALLIRGCAAWARHHHLKSLKK